MLASSILLIHNPFSFLFNNGTIKQLAAETKCMASINNVTYG